MTTTKNSSPQPYPRGLKNNNPGNIRQSPVKYLGEVQPSQDTAFKQFQTMAFGYRAMFVLLHTYSKNGHKTLRMMLCRYAPPCENNTKLYIEFVCKTARQLEKKLTSIGKELSMKVTAPLVALGAASLHLADVQEKAEAKVQQAIKSTSGAAKLNFEQLKAYASQLQGKTLFGDEKILNDSTAQLLTFTNIAGDNFKRTQAVALDLATVLDGDLKSASIQLGKALNDPVNNLSALSRSGIQFSDEQKQVIKSLAETNRLAEAQGVP